MLPVCPWPWHVHREVLQAAGTRSLAEVYLQDLLQLVLQSQADKPLRGSPSSAPKEQQTPVMSTVNQVRVVESNWITTKGTSKQATGSQRTQCSVMCTHSINLCARVAKQCSNANC